MVEQKPTEQRGHQIVEALLTKPSTKPNFGNWQMPEVLKRAQAFLPEFIQSTDKILSNPEQRQASQMDVHITPGNQYQNTNPAGGANVGATGHAPTATTINMEIGVGVFDMGEQEQAMQEQREGKVTGLDAQLPPGLGYHETSTEPIMRILKDQKPGRCQEHAGAAEDSDDSDSSSSSGCEDRFMQFDSSDDADGEEAMVDAQSMTTKSSGAERKRENFVGGGQKRPLIQEIASIQFANAEEESKDQQPNAPPTTQAIAGLKRRFREM